MSELLPSARRSNDIVESWGGTNDTCTLSSPAKPDRIPSYYSRIVCVHLMSGLLACGKMLPLAYMPLTLELEIGDADDAFEGINNQWSISRPKLCCDVLQLDGALNNSYISHLLASKTLPILFQGIHSIRSAFPVGSSQFTLAVARGFSRLRGMFISMYLDGTGTKFTNTFDSLC